MHAREEIVINHSRSMGDAEEWILCRLLIDLRLRLY